MAGNKPLSPEEFEKYNTERKRLDKVHTTHQLTWDVMYKSLCPACAYNAANGKKIIYNCPNCRRRYWHNCSPRQVRSGEILRKLEQCYGNIEWLKAYLSDGSLAYEWKKHESTYQQDFDGKWVPKQTE